MVRRIHRVDLPFATRKHLHAAEKQVSGGGGKAREEWAKFRKSAACRPVVFALGVMAGPRQRCAYCSDSHASEIDHFLPIDRRQDMTFRWKNMQWSCGLCNRRKLARFPVDENGTPLLVDPAVCDPWSVLTLDTDTGFIAPRFIGVEFSRSGEATLDVFKAINFEAVTEGRYRVIKRYLRTFENIVESGDTGELRRQLAEEVRQDDFGIASWFAVWEGSRESVPVEVAQVAPKLWRRFQRMWCIPRPSSGASVSVTRGTSKAGRKSRT